MEVLQVQAEGLPLQTEVSVVPLTKRRKTNNVVGVGQVRHIRLHDLMTEAQLTILRFAVKVSDHCCHVQSSGRQWKEPGDRAGSLKNPLLSTSWDKKMQLKAERDAFKTIKSEAIAAHKEKLAVCWPTPPMCLINSAHTM